MSTAPTSIGPIRETRINQVLYVGEIGVANIQAAIGYALADGGSFMVVIPFGYSASDSIAAVTNGSANVLLIDQRGSEAQAYVWTGQGEYVSASFTQLAGFIATGTSATPLGCISLMFNPGGTSGNGSGNLIVAANPNTGRPGFNIELMSEDGTVYTYLRCDEDANHQPRIQMPEQVIITGELSAPDATFNTCEVGGSPVRTFDNSPGAMVYPPAGVAVSNGNGWTTPINPAFVVQSNSSGDIAATGQMTAAKGMTRGMEIVFPVLTDANTMTTAGTYWCQAWGNRPTNSTSYQFLEVMNYANGTAVIQRLTPAATNALDLGVYYQRFYSDFTNAWSQWYEYSPSATVPPIPLEDDPLANTMRA